MTRKIIGSLLAGALLLAIPGIALADHEDTLMNVDFTTTAKSKKSGTKRSPRPANLSIELTQSTRSGTGQPASSAALNITLPKQFQFRGKMWPKKLRCDPLKANNAKSDRACPKRSSIGSGHVTATAGNGHLVSEIAVRAYVTTSGDLGLWLTTATPLPINQMLVGKVSHGRTIRVAIPSNIQQPLVGVKSAIRELRFSLPGTARVNGRSVGAVESTGCPTSKKWTLTFQSVYTHGSATDTATAPCRS
jgi:hypothetical protein